MWITHPDELLPHPVTIELEFRYRGRLHEWAQIVEEIFSVGNVEGAGAKARIAKYYKAYPGVHVDGLEKFLYPIPTPGSRG